MVRERPEATVMGISERTKFSVPPTHPTTSLLARQEWEQVGKPSPDSQAPSHANSPILP